MSLATLNGNAVTRARMQVPAFGLWWADVDLDEEVVLSGAVTLVIADVTLRGTIVSGGAIHGHAAYRIVAGASKWHTQVKRKSYQNDAGVKVATIAQDVASDVGERVTDLPTTRRGPHYARVEGLASEVLHEIAPRSWYADFDGVVHFGTRPATTYAGDAPRTRVDKAVGVIELATESLVGLVPGVSIDGSNPATDVEFELDAKRLTVRVYANAPTSRRLFAWQRLFNALDPLRKYKGTFEFRVISQTGERLDLQPVRTVIGFGDLSRVPVRGPAGVKAKVALGELVLVAFADVDPSRPQVIAHDSADAPGWMPQEILMGEAPQLAVARMTDPVIAGPFAGTITGPVGSRIKAGV